MIQVSMKVAFDGQTGEFQTNVNEAISQLEVNGNTVLGVNFSMIESNRGDKGKQGVALVAMIVYDKPIQK